MGIIRQYMAAAANGVSAHDFVSVTNWNELVNGGRSPARAQQAAAPALRESLDDWKSRHLARQDARDFKRGLAASLVDTAPAVPEVVLVPGGVLQESWLTRMTGRRPAADRQEWVRSHRNPR